MKLTDETRLNDIINFPTTSFRILSNYKKTKGLYKSNNITQYNILLLKKGGDKMVMKKKAQAAMEFLMT